MLEGWDLLRRGLIWHIGSSDSVDIWEDPWIPSILGFCVSCQKLNNVQFSKVSSLINMGTGLWNHQKLSSLFNPEEIKAISSVNFSLLGGVDKLLSCFACNGEYSVKSGALHLTVNIW